MCAASKLWVSFRFPFKASQKAPPKSRRAHIGVLFGCFARKIDGPGLPGGLIIYQGHLFPVKGHLCAPRCLRSFLWQSSLQSVTKHPPRRWVARHAGDEDALAETKEAIGGGWVNLGISCLGSRGLSPLLRYKGVLSLYGGLVFGRPLLLFVEVVISHSPAL